MTSGHWLILLQAVFVMPSSSARFTQLPRAVDKLVYCEALKKLRDYLCGRGPAPLPRVPSGNPFYDASPLHWVGGGDAAFHLVHARCDTILPYGQTEVFAGALAAVGGDVTMETYEGCGHGLRDSDQGLLSNETAAVDVLAAIDAWRGRGGCTPAVELMLGCGFNPNDSLRVVSGSSFPGARLEFELHDRGSADDVTFQLWRWHGDAKQSRVGAPIFLDRLAMGSTGAWTRHFVYPRSDLEPGAKLYFELASEPGSEFSARAIRVDRAKGVEAERVRRPRPARRRQG